MTMSVGLRTLSISSVEGVDVGRDLEAGGILQESATLDWSWVSVRNPQSELTTVGKSVSKVCKDASLFVVPSI
jgi:hypothetical protein